MLKWQCMLHAAQAVQPQRYICQQHALYTGHSDGKWTALVLYGLSYRPVLTGYTRSRVST